MDLFPCGDTTRTLNLRDAQFKDYLKEVILNGSEKTGNNGSLAIASALEIMSLEWFKIQCSPLEVSTESA